MPQFLITAQKLRIIIFLYKRYYLNTTNFATNLIQFAIFTLGVPFTEIKVLFPAFGLIY